MTNMKKRTIVHNRRSVTAMFLAALVTLTTILPAFSDGGEIHLINDLGGYGGRLSIEAQMERDWNEDITAVAKGAWLDVHAGEDRERTGYPAASPSVLEGTEINHATGSDLARDNTVPVTARAYDVFEDIDDDAAAGAAASYLKKARKEEKAESGSFLRKMLKEAVIPEEGVPRENDLKKEILALYGMNDENYDVFRTDREYIPKAGDIIFAAGHISTGEDSPASGSDIPASPGVLPDTVRETEVKILTEDRETSIRRNAKHAVLAGIVIAGPEDTGSDKVRFIYSIGSDRVEIGALARNEVRIIGYADMEELHDRYCGILEESEEEDPEEDGLVPEEFPEELLEEIPAVPNEKTEYIWKNDAMTVTVTLTDPEAVPDDAELTVVPVTKDSGYNYRAYMDALAGEIHSAGENNTILYDVAFLAEEKDENGEPTGRCLELQPEHDRVKVSFRFNNAQLTEEIGAKDAEKLRVVHLPLAEEAREYADTTKEAVDIAASDISPEALEARVAVGTSSGRVEFETESFSVFALVYTVDFHWEVNGKTYGFSIPGGGYVSFTALLELLGIAEDNPENTESTESTETPAELEELVLTLKDVEVSEQTKRLAAEVEKVEFSDPALIWVGKTEENTTVGELKETNRLECRYSSQLTGEQIEEINAQTVEAGDWALISVLPFDSEEALTVTMKNGDVFTIQITDARDPFGLDDRTLSFVYKTSDNSGYSVQSSTFYNDLAGAQVSYTKTGGVEYCDKSASVWLFEYDTVQDAYYLTNGYHTDGSTRYFTMHLDGENSRITLEAERSNASPVKVEKNPDGTFRLYTEQGEDRFYLTYNETYHSFYSHRTASPGENAGFHFCLAEASGSGSSHKATLISAADIQPGQKLVIYQRIWGTDSQGTQVAYYYAIDGSGTLVPVSNSSDSVYWKGDAAIEWTIADLGNGYYTLYNEATGKYLVPKSNGIVFTGEETSFGGDPKHLSVSLPGKDTNGTYTTKIASWDYNANVTYGLSAAASGLTSAEYLQSQEFYFAARDPIVQGELTEVDTVDSAEHGITIEMFDFSGSWGHSNRLAFMTDVLPYDEWRPYELPQGLAQRVLDSDGFPVSAEGSHKSLKGIFYPTSGSGTSTRTEANHLFLQNTYNETGFYKYSCFENYAYLNSDGNFSVYEQIGTPFAVNGGSRNSYSHTTHDGTQTYVWNNDYEGNHDYYQRGNFLPYNALGVTTRRDNVYDPDLVALENDDPRKGEDLYLIGAGSGNANYFFGMIMSAKFIQNPDGISDHGDPMVYEFNGDDDLWVYVDDVLLLDMGGVHDAFRGKIDFNTGDIYVNGRVYNISDGTTVYYPHTTIKDQFKKAGRFPDGSAWDDSRADEYFTGNTFRDFTTHDFKMFYMERGAGASNLELQFNLPVLDKSQFSIKKELPETETGQAVQDEYAKVSFFYEAYVKDTATGQFTKVTRKYLSDHDLGTPHYDDPEETPVIWKSDSDTESVFEIRQGAAAIFPAIDDSVQWYVTEVNPDTDTDMLFRYVVSNSDPDPAVTDGTQSGKETIQKRNRVIFQNRPEDEIVNELRITKKINGTPYNENDAFEYRIFLESTEGSLVPYSMGKYWQTDARGRYIYYQNGQRVLQSEDPNGPYTYTLNGETVTSASPRYAEHTSTNGSLGDIRDGDTIIIRGLLEGTDFYVYERTNYDYMSPSAEQMAGRYVFEGTEVTDAWNRNTGEDPPEEASQIAHLYDEPGGLGNEESGLIQQYSISDYEQEHAAWGVILPEKDAKVLVKNTPAFEITLEKKWPEESDDFSMDDLTEESKVVFTLQRYKLDSRHGTLHLTGILRTDSGGTVTAGAPAGADPVYQLVKDGKAVKTLKHSDLGPDGQITITDLPTGTYTVTAWDHLSGFDMAFSADPAAVTVTEGGESSASVTCTYTGQKGTLKIRKRMIGAYSWDNGALTYTITGPNQYSHTETLTVSQIMDGEAVITIPDLPIGLYTVTEQVSGARGTHAPGSRVVHVSGGETAWADFTGNYENERIPVIFHFGHSPNSGNGWTEDSSVSHMLPAGSTIRASFSLRNCTYYGAAYPYGITADCGTGTLYAGTDDDGGRTERSAEFSIPSDAESYHIYIKSRCDNGVWAPSLASAPVIVTAGGIRSLSMMRTGVRLLGAAQGTDYEDVNTVMNTVTLPELSQEEAEKKYFILDNTWSLTVELTKDRYTAKAGDTVIATGDTGENFWRAVLKHASIRSGDEEGDPYYYYLADVSESHVPWGMTPVFDMDGEKTLMTSRENPHILSVTNRMVLKGSLELTKLTAGTGADTSKDFVFDVSFTLPKAAAENTEYPTRTGETAGTPVSVTAGSSSASAEVTLRHGQTWTVEDLPAGTQYTITERDYSADGYSPETTSGSSTGIIPGGRNVKESVEITNTYEPGVLTVEKTIAGNAADSEKVFQFEAVITGNNTGNGNAGTITVNGNTRDFHYTNGTATVPFALKGGEKADITVKKAGVNFVVREVSADQGGYETTVTADGGVTVTNKTVSGTVNRNTAITVNYTNTREQVAAEARKVWKNGEQVIDWPSDVEKVEFTLCAIVGEMEAAAVNDASMVSMFPDIEAVKEVNQNTAGHKAAWTGLPARVITTPSAGGSPAVWSDVSYLVKETRIIRTDGTTETVDVTAEEGIITNRLKMMDIHILKKDQKSGEPLSGARFRLKRYDSTYETVLRTWEEQEVSSLPETKGTLQFDGLAPGYYELEETESPPGYNPLAASPRFRIREDPATGELQVEYTDSSGMVTYEQSDKTFTVRNGPGVALPATGGPGSRFMYLLGLLVMGAAAWITIRRIQDGMDQ